MSVNYNTTTINTRLQAVVTAIDGGGSNGVLRILDGSNNILSSPALSRPCGFVTGGVLTFNSLPLVDPAASASGPAAAARIEDSAGNVIVSGLTVGLVGVDILISNGLGTTLISSGQTVAVTAATITGH